MQNNTLEDFFKSELGNYKPHLDFEEKAIIDEIQLKSRFSKFNLYRFNLYYALAIFSGFVISLCCAGHYIYTVNSTRQENLNLSSKKINSIPILEKKIQIKSFSNNIPTNKALSNKTKNSTYFRHIEKTNKSVASQLDTFKLSKKELKSEIQNQTQDTIKKASVVIPQRKKVIIVRRDTILQTDTLKLKKIKK